MLITVISGLLAWAPLIHAQFPAEPQYDQVVEGKLGDGYRVSLKEVRSLCETTPGVKSYSGYITTPPSAYSQAVTNSFFWFFESRKAPSTAPLVVFLGGGPGHATTQSVVSDVGPCWVNPDSNSTTPNPWSFNNEANLLFIDQPSMSGYSYDIRVNGTMQFLPTDIGGLGQGIPIVPETAAQLPEKSNDTVGLGTFGSQNVTATTNTTENAAQVFWAAMQTWSAAFPQYIPANNRFSIWTESYGGRYGPAFARLFYEKNAQIATGAICESQARPFEIDTLGLINAILDPAILVRSYPDFAVNNTYGVQMVNSTVLAAMQQNLTAPGTGCLDLISTCNAARRVSDPENTGANSTVNGLCAIALSRCTAGVQALPPSLSGLTIDDITQPSPGSVVPPYYNGFFAQSWVQQALGAAVNWTENSNTVAQAFFANGELVLDGSMESLSTLLDAGVSVALINGDRDYQINWLGGERAALAIPWAGNASFAAAGYVNVTTNETYVGGLVRQAGRLSFSRIFQAGHQGPAYQPETYYRLLERSLRHVDLADGKLPMEGPNGTTLATVGPASVRDVTMEAEPPVKPVCYQLSAALTCTKEQLEVVGSGRALFKDFVLQKAE